MKTDSRVCVIGAGCSGITAIKNLVQAGVTNVICYEKNNQVGGNWIYTAKESHSSVCETTHIISSKKLSEYIDFPMPDDYPDYPSHSQVLAYFNSYADHFGLRPFIRFNTAVQNIQKLANKKWEVTLATGEVELFDYMIVANGHHSAPRMPQFAGNFKGKIIHSHSYKNNKGFANKRVLVVGAGNSGCDCAVEISRVAKKVAISMRRPQYIIPKFLMGRPTDTFNETIQKIPSFLRAPIQKISLRLQVGSYKKYGMEDPDYPVLKCHPTLNSELLYKIRHGKVTPRKGIERLDGNTVHFADGRQDDYDVIVLATGYEVKLPFFDKDFIDYSNADRIELYMRMIHPEHPSLFFIGLVQPQGCVWPVADYQSKLMANHVAGRWAIPENLPQLAKKETDQIASQFIAAKRHTLEVRFHPFVKKIKTQIPANAPQWTGTATPKEKVKRIEKSSVNLN